MNVTQADPGVKTGRRGRKGKARVDNQGGNHDAREPAGDVERGVVEDPFRCISESVLFAAHLSYGARLTAASALSMSRDRIEITGRNRELRERRGKVRGGELVPASGASVKRWIGELGRAGVTSRAFDPRDNRRRDLRFAMRTGPNCEVDPSWPPAPENDIFRAVRERFIFRTTYSDRATMVLLALLSFAKGRRRFRVRYGKLAEKLRRPTRGGIAAPSASTIARWVEELVKDGVISHALIPSGDGREHEFEILKDVDPNCRDRLADGDTTGSRMATPRLADGDTTGSRMATYIENRKREPFFENGWLENTPDDAQPDRGPTTLEERGAAATDIDARVGGAQPSNLRDETSDTPSIRPAAPEDDAELSNAILLASLGVAPTREGEAWPVEKKPGGCAAGKAERASIGNESIGQAEPGALDMAPLAIYRPGENADPDDFTAGRAEEPAGPIASPDGEPNAMPVAPGLAFVAGETPQQIAVRWLAWDRTRGGQPIGAGDPNPLEDLVALYRAHLKHRPWVNYFGRGSVEGETEEQNTRRWVAWHDAQPWAEAAEGLVPLPGMNLYVDEVPEEPVASHEAQRGRDCETDPTRADPPRTRPLDVIARAQAATTFAVADSDVARARAGMRRALGLSLDEGPRCPSQRRYEAHLYSLLGQAGRDTFHPSLRTYTRSPRGPEEIVFATARWDRLDPADRSRLLAIWEADPTPPIITPACS